MFLVARGPGVSLVPDSLAAFGVSGAAFVPLTLPRRSGCFAWNPEREAPGLQEALVEQLRSGSSGTA